MLKINVKLNIGKFPASSCKYTTVVRIAWSLIFFTSVKEHHAFLTLKSEQLFKDM